MLHEINPGITRIIINENNIIFVATFGNKRGRSPYIRVYKSKRLGSFRITRGVRELNLFSQLTTSTLKRGINGYMTKNTLLD